MHTANKEMQVVQGGDRWGEITLGMIQLFDITSDLFHLTRHPQRSTEPSGSTDNNQSTDSDTGDAHDQEAAILAVHVFMLVSDGW